MGWKKKEKKNADLLLLCCLLSLQSAGVDLPAQAKLPQMCPHKMMLFERSRVCHKTVVFFSPTVILFPASANGGHHPDPEF